MSAFENGLARADARRQDREAHDMLQRKFLADQYQAYANNIRLPDATQDPEGYKKALDLKQQALDAMQKVYSPDHHASLAEHLHGLIFGPKQAQGTPQSSQAPTLPPTAIAASGQTAAPPAAAPAHPFAHNPVYGDILKGLDALGTHLKGFAQPNGPKQPLPALTRFAAVPNESELTAQDAAKKFQQEEELLKLKNQGALEVAKERGKNPAGRPVPFGRGSVSVKDAQELAGNGQEFHDQDGNAIDISKLPESAKLTPWAWGNKIFYTIGDQVPRIVKADNLVTAQPEEGVLTPAAEVSPEAQLGAQRVPTTSTHQVPGMNPGEKINLTSTTTPVTPTRAAPASAVPPGGAPAKAIPKKPWSKQPGAQAAKRSESPSSGSSMPPEPPPFASGTFMTQGKTTKPVIAAMDVVGANVFGGNGVDPLWENADMYDNPELAKALNKGLTLNQLTIPGTESDPSFMQTLATAVGVTGWSQTQIRNANAAARADIERLGGQRALDMLSRMSAFQEDLTALRKATSGSASASTVRTMVRAAPIYNVYSAQDFRNQLSATLNTGAAVFHAYPEINPELGSWWKQGARAARGSPVSAQAPKVGSGTIVQKSPSTGQYRYSTDGGQSWEPGQPPSK